ncbi:MAG: tetratricopeptide repeat protein [Rhodospirillales bacterium]|nr:tetratricopeptide repeat protein [Rhodospirillales bacterium]
MNRKERRKQRSGIERAVAGAAPATPEALFRVAFEHHRAGRLEEARVLYARALAGQPDNPELLHMAGVAAYEEDDLDAAVRLIGKALERGLRRPEIHNNLGNALQKSGRTTEAEAAFREALSLAPGYAEAHYNLGNLLKELGRLDEAIEEYGRALKMQPNDPQIHHNLGSALHAMSRIDEAIKIFERAVEIKPDHVGALFNLGNILRHQGRSSGAITYFERILALDPTDLRSLVCLAATKEQKGDQAGALDIFRKVLAVDPSHQQANAGCLKMLERLCAWDEVARYRPAVRQAALNALEEGEMPAEDPFGAVSRDMDPAYTLRVARSHSHALAEIGNQLRQRVAAVPRPLGTGRIVVGYVSSDFRNHAISHLVGGLFAHHDRNTLKVIAYSTGADDASVYRRQVEAGCDAFVDLHAIDALQAARRIREDGTDILIDLNGHTAWNRLEIFALRPAPVQVTYLGFPGTTGADFIDYVLADTVVAPPEHASYFSEKIVYVPHTYQANGPQPIAEEKPTRSECGLPEKAFVFASFCHNYKIEPVMFQIWMDILGRVPGSVIWLFRSSATAEENLRREAAVRGIDPLRLIFGGHVPKDRHLARASLADLALDTRIYGGHTTTSDMLWAGVPVITLLGGHFASRVGASLLRTVGLDELVTISLEEYRALAVRLAQDPAELSRLRRTLADNRDPSPLFDTPRFARNLERAFERMWAHHRAGLEPASFTVVED